MSVARAPPTPMAKKSNKKPKKRCCDKPARKMCKRCPRRKLGL